MAPLHPSRGSVGPLASMLLAVVGLLALMAWPSAAVASGPSSPPAMIGGDRHGVVVDTVPVDESVAREPDGSALLDVGHAFRFVGTIIGVGALVALLRVVRSDKEVLRVVLGMARMMGLVIATGGALEWAAYQQFSGEGLGGLVTTARGGAVTLALVGGVLITFGLTERRSLTPTGATFRWTPGRSSVPGLLGAVVVIASYGFDGHRAAVGPAAVGVAVDVLHVAAATIWGGGICVLAVMGLMRLSRGRSGGFVESTIRLSATAPWLLVVLVFSGVAMAGLVSGADTGVASSPWGRTLLVKVILVGIAIAIGLYNRFALLPQVRDGDAQDLVLNQLRVVVAVEAGFVLAATFVAVALVRLVP